ncbi:MAG: septal ring lytic transglycosylase RlpA family protein [Deltaproteobacteria bacterium]|nr:septal ring lytic transglycosylase RlpA family protein [Deltaproteobacteria bacterium]RLA88491.1 MAG: septal ring lytic transglycosylase RlpA family protein [Deltaproteobacteria bacterium]
MLKEIIKLFTLQKIILILITFIFIFYGCGRSKPPVKKDTFYLPPPPKKMVKVQEGIASWYGPGFHGKPTSCGEIYNMYQMTAAHKTLPLGTKVMVTNLENGRSVEVTINDRGPFVKGRIIDLSYAAAKQLGIIGKGTAKVRIEVLSKEALLMRKDLFSAPKQKEFTIQVASFIEQRNAIKLKNDLSKNFKNVYIIPLLTSQRIFYRVRVGKFRTRDEAVKFAKRLTIIGYDVLITSR